MATFLSPEWVDLQSKSMTGLSAADNLDTTIQFTVTGGPNGDFSYFWTFEGGKLVSSSVNADSSPSVTLTSPYAEACEIQAGSLDPSVAFMQGRLKIGGDMSIVLGLLPMLSSPEYARAREELAANTEIGK